MMYISKKAFFDILPSKKKFNLIFPDRNEQGQVDGDAEGL